MFDIGYSVSTAEENGKRMGRIASRKDYQELLELRNLCRDSGITEFLQLKELCKARRGKVRAENLWSQDFINIIMLHLPHYTSCLYI